MAEPHPDAQLRVTAAQRDHAAAELREAAADERIDFDELEARLPVVLGAKTRGDLISVLRDLVPSARMDAVIGVASPLGAGVGFSWEEPWVLQVKKWENIKLIGPWRLPPFMELIDTGFGIHLDATVAVPLAPVIDIVITGKGKVVLVVPDGWGVDVTQLTADAGEMSGMSSTVRSRPDRGKPRLVLRGSFGGSVVVRNPGWWDRRAMAKWEKQGRPAPPLSLPAPGEG